jgi:hypothetical protein
MANLERDNDSPVIKIYEGSRHHDFFLFVLTIIDITEFKGKFDQVVSREQFSSDKKFIDFTDFQSRIHSLTDSLILTIPDEEHHSFSSLSLNEIVYLLSLAEWFAQMLLIADAESLRNLKYEVSVKRPDIPQNWDRAFLKEAQFVFSDIKEKFKDHPEIIKAIDELTGQ